MIHLHELHTRRSGLIAAAVLGLVALLTAAFWDYTQDDVFITFAYSRNIAQGEGFVFNPGEHVQGSTTPLWALLLAGVYWITPDLLHAGNLLSGLFLLVTAGFAVDLLRRDTSFFARAALAITLAVSPLIYVSYGMETLFYCAILTGGLWLWHRDRRPAAMIAAAALTWTRADGVVLAGAFGLIALWDSARAIRQDQAVPLRRPWRGLPWRLGLTYIAGIAPWFLFAWAYFGTPLPQTFSAKEEFLQGTRFVRVGADWWDSFYGNNPLTLLAVPLIVLGAWRALISPGLRPLVLWAGLYTTGYTALNVTAFWYYTPLLVALILLAALGGDWLARRLVHAAIDRRIVFGDRRVVVGGAVGLVLICAGLAFVRAWDNHKPPPRMVAYETAGRWIDAHAGPDDSLLVKDLGIVGYYADRYTLDSFGLIVPDMHYTHDTYAAAKYKTDWVLTTQYWAMKQLVEQDWFHYHYAPLAQFSAPGDHEFSPMTAYRRRLDTAPPGQIVSGFDLPLTCIVSLEKGEPVPAKTRARLLDVDGVIRVEAAHPFLWGQYPDSAAAGDETLIEQIALPLDMPAGRYRWELDCERVAESGDIEVLPVDQAPGYITLDAVTWAGFATLRGVIFPDGLETWSGGSLPVALHWGSLGAADDDYSVFLHLADQDGRVWAQGDGYPRGGDRPATTWTAGETITDVRRIYLPPDLPPGDYRLILGWYDWREDTRVSLPDGADAVTLPVTVINRWPGGSGLP